MEKNNERGQSRLRSILIASGLGIGAVLLATACPSGQTKPPTAEQVANDGDYFNLPGAIAANGEPVRCYKYGSQSENTNVSKSWFGFDCDFQGTAQLPGETPTTTSVTTTTVLR